MIMGFYDIFCFTNFLIFKAILFWVKRSWPLDLLVNKVVDIFKYLLTNVGAWTTRAETTQRL